MYSNATHDIYLTSSTTLHILRSTDVSPPVFTRLGHLKAGGVSSRSASSASNRARRFFPHSEPDTLVTELFHRWRLYSQSRGQVYHFVFSCMITQIHTEVISGLTTNKIDYNHLE
jgi:hypothetical protein